MNTIKWQALALAGVVLVSAFLTRVGVEADRTVDSEAGSEELASLEESLPQEDSSDFFEDSLSFAQVRDARRAPTRDWDVLDPQVSAEAVLIQSLDGAFPFYHSRTYAVWPTASLTKLLTAVVVLEEIGENRKITITERAVATEGIAGNLRDGEIYSAQDLLKIMLLTSSNDAAVAFEDHAGGQDEFVRLMTRKARELGMSNTLFYDGTGLSDLNSSTASDLLRLLRYIVETYPQILQWTRIPGFLVQPINDIDSREVRNINPLVNNLEFLGGKTGTSPRARENLISLFSLGQHRIVMIILGSRDRAAESEKLLSWARKAYGL
ncbi:hypothetical protein CL629_04755 [bacterium]|nr:hypothetical protein [bacterium]|tara:strand:- start:3279 stop:4247 length:969 start_codon:yes stop_codon:yes gene_type:complete